MRVLKGIPASSGIGIGKIFVWRVKEEDFSYKGLEAKSLWNKAKEILKKDLESKINNLSEIEKELVSFYLLLLDDPYFQEYLYEKIEDGLDFKRSLEETIEKFKKEFLSLDSYFQARAQDIEALKQEIFRVLRDESYPNLNEPSILVSQELTPWQLINLPKENLLGIVSSKGGVLSHLSIIARNFNLPLVIGIDISEIKEKSLGIIDGEKGILILDPTPLEVDRYKKLYEKVRKIQEESKLFKNYIPKKMNNKSLIIASNIGSLEDAYLALEQGAMGIGLFRTEFLFLSRNNPPSEEEQYEVYKKVGDLFSEYPVIIRTLDIGGDKFLPYIKFEKEENPFLGLRGLRWSLHEKELFKTQIKAILRAKKGNNIHLMFPMVNFSEEIVKAKKIIEEAQEELKSEGKEYDVPPIGIMLETPISILNIHNLAPLVDFFSLGTNDLLQYTFATDRTNEKVSYLYKPYHPSFWKLIKEAIDSAHKFGKWIGICGELGGDLKAFPLLYSLDIDEVSVAPLKVPMIKLLSSKVSKIDISFDKLKEEELEEILEKNYERILENI
ncbi:MAG: phosphoenolpyruvate--protein phosphotransferase [Dictyoglomus sp. NZ13-RE01]|nr:MAG: phosphoenolpyruvate--protein phosphotransferase [Dictyoglomus sp. NZ13-RE01]